MEPDSRQPNSATPLRLIDVRVSADRPNVHLGGRLAAILTEPESRSAAAQLIAATVAGPRPEAADASIEVDGQVVSVRTLPEPMLPPGAPPVIDRAVLTRAWQAGCARRRDELAAEHSSRRLERHRIDAALEGAVDAPSEEAEPASPEPDQSPEPVDEHEPLRVRIRVLLDPADEPAVPLPEGQLLADAWDAHTALVRACEAAGLVPEAQLESLERRVDIARRVVADMPRPVPDEVREKIEQSHREVLEAEAQLLAAKRRHRTRAVAHYEQTVAVELVALADAGIDSHASFLVAVAAGQAAEAGERAAAEAELAAARAELDDARLVADVPTRLELGEREELMRRRATELIGRPPGPDPAGELRALRVESERSPETLEEIAVLLRGAGVTVTDDVAASARAFLVPPLRPIAEPAPAVDAGPAAAITDDEIAGLTAQRLDHERALLEIEDELERLEQSAAIAVELLDANDFAAALACVVAEYRAGTLLNGTLPMVIDGVLDGIEHDARNAAVGLLAVTDDIQTIVVSDDPEVLQSLANAGAALVRWPERAKFAAGTTGDT